MRLPHVSQVATIIPTNTLCSPPFTRILYSLGFFEVLTVLYMTHCGAVAEALKSSASGEKAVIFYPS
jgi:hypothetical protein